MHQPRWRELARDWSTAPSPGTILNYASLQMLQFISIYLWKYIKWVGWFSDLVVAAKCQPNTPNFNILATDIELCKSDIKLQNFVGHPSRQLLSHNYKLWMNAKSIKLSSSAASRNYQMKLSLNLNSNDFSPSSNEDHWSSPTTASVNAICKPNVPKIRGKLQRPSAFIAPLNLIPSLTRVIPSHF